MSLRTVGAGSVRASHRACQGATLSRRCGTRHHGERGDGWPAWSLQTRCTPQVRHMDRVGRLHVELTALDAVAQDLQHAWKERAA